MIKSIAINIIRAAYLAIILATYSATAFAGLKKDLIELSQTQEPSRMRELFRAIIGSKKLDFIGGYDLKAEQLNAIFGAILKIKPENSAKLILSLLPPATGADKPLKNVLLAIADLVNTIDTVPQKIKSLLKIDGNQHDIQIIFSHSLKHPIDADDFNALVAVLGWADFSNQQKKWLLEDLLEPSLQNWRFIIPELANNNEKLMALPFHEMSLNAEQLNAIFGALLKLKPENSAKLILGLLKAAAWADKPLKNALPAIADLVNRLDSLPQAAQSSLKNDDNQENIRAIFEHSLKDPIDADDFKALVAVLGWADFSNKYKKWLLADLLKPSLQNWRFIIPEFVNNNEKLMALPFTDISLNAEQLDAIFGAMLKSKPENSAKFILSLLSAAAGADKPLKNALPVIAALVNAFDTLPQEVQSSLKNDDNQNYIRRIFSDSLKHPIDADDFRALVAILGWADFSNQYKGWLLGALFNPSSENWRLIIPELEKNNGKLGLLPFYGLGLTAEQENSIIAALVKAKPDEAGTQLFNLLSVATYAEQPNKQAAAIIADYVRRIDSLPEGVQSLVKAGENQLRIYRVFAKLLRPSMDADEIRSLFSLLEWRGLEKVYRAMLFENLSKLMSSSKTGSADKNIENLISTVILPDLYKTNIEQFSKMVFSEEPKLVLPQDDELPQAGPSKVICNQEGYDEGVTINCEPGKPIKLDDQTPIGYNVHLPQGEVKAILTHVYGGDEATTRKERMYYPKALSALDTYLLAHGVAIVYLNLVDLRELKVFQALMPEDLHKRIHASINKYFQEFQAPETLHKDLAVLKDKANFLSGSSFGGRGAAMHPQLYPKTFKGYISLGGALSFARMDQTTPLIGGKQFPWAPHESQKWLDPINEIAKIKDPLLISHNLDDNRISSAVSISFYEAALKNKLGNLVRLLLTTRGGPIPLEEKIRYKGHFLPTDPANLKRLGAYILRFIIDGPSALPAASELGAHMYKLLTFGKSSGQYFNLERLKNEVYRHYMATGQKEISDKVWDAQYLPMLHALYLVGLYDLSKDQSEGGFIAHTIKLASDRLADSLYSNAVKLHASTFADYLIEKYLWPIDQKLLSQMIIDSKEISQIFKIWISSLATNGLSPDLNKFLLQEFLVANPEVVAGLLNAHMPEGIPENLKNVFKRVRDEFETWLNQSKSIATKTWQEAVSAMIAKQRARNLEKFKTLAGVLATPALQDISIIAAQFEELLGLADPLLSNLAYVPDIRSTYRKLVEQHGQCQSLQCKAYYADSLLSLGLLLGNKNFMKESVLKAAEALKAVYPLEKNLSDLVVNKHLARLMARLGEKKRPFSQEDLKNFEAAILGQSK